MRVIAQPAPRTRRRLVLDLLLRVALIAVVTTLILGLLPAIAGAAA